MAKIYLTEKEVASRFSLSPKQLQRDRRLGRGFRYRVFGRSIRYHIDEIEEDAKLAAVITNRFPKL